MGKGIQKKNAGWTLRKKRKVCQSIMFGAYRVRNIVTEAVTATYVLATYNEDGKMTCVKGSASGSDWVSTCDRPKICGAGGCYLPSAGRRICKRTEKSHRRDCAGNQKCDMTTGGAGSCVADGGAGDLLEVDGGDPVGEWPGDGLYNCFLHDTQTDATAAKVAGFPVYKLTRVGPLRGEREG